MAELEKVIKALECCLHAPMHMQCDKCPYTVPNCVKTMRTDAISLLKAQEPIEPIVKQEMDDVCSCIDAVAYCGKCGAYIGRLKQNYCHECGRAVKWE